jgi:hypothetical protein
MKRMMLFAVLFYCLFSAAFSFEIKHIREFTLFQDENTFISAPGSFFVTEDNILFVLDKKASDIKIFDENGKLVNVFGKKGQGPDEFILPYVSTYKKPYIALADTRRRRFLIYKRSGIGNLEFEKLCLNLDMPDDIDFMDNGKLLVAGAKRDKSGKWQNLYIYDCEKNECDFLLSYAASYGYKSESEFKRDFDNNMEYIGSAQYCDWIDDTIYHAWTGNIKINKINIKTRNVASFGKKTENYFLPYVTPEIKKAFYNKKAKIILEAWSKMSYVMDVFAINSKKVGLVYVGPLKNKKGVNVMLQLYSSAGNFIGEVELLQAKASTSYELFFYFRRDKGLLYVMDTETSETFDQIFYVHEYRVEE